MQQDDDTCPLQGKVVGPAPSDDGELVQYMQDRDIESRSDNGKKDGTCLLGASMFLTMQHDDDTCSLHGKFVDPERDSKEVDIGSDEPLDAPLSQQPTCLLGASLFLTMQHDDETCSLHGKCNVPRSPSRPATPIPDEYDYEALGDTADNPCTTPCLLDCTCRSEATEYASPSSRAPSETPAPPQVDLGMLLCGATADESEDHPASLDRQQVCCGVPAAVVHPHCGIGSSTSGSGSTGGASYEESGNAARMSRRSRRTTDVSATSPLGGPGGVSSPAPRPLRM